MGKIWIVYFSHTGENYVAGNIKQLEIGNTRLVADQIQAITKGTSYEIQPKQPYPFHYQACTSLGKQELQENVRPQLQGVMPSIQKEDLVFLGYPNWWGTMPMPVLTFLDEWKQHSITIAPFCTHEGSGLGQSIQDLQRLYPTFTVKQGLAIRGSEALNSEAEIKQWISSIVE